MNRIVPIISSLLLVCAANFTFAQSDIQKFFNPFDYQNQYYNSDNPAFLHLDTSEELLLISTEYNGSEGDFKRFMDPGAISNYNLSFTGKKTLDSLQLFKGSFGLTKEEYKDRQWLTTKYYSSGNPFLLGDSTTGRSRYNGINIDASYNRLIFGNYYAGAKINYFVDEGLKTVSPRPVSEHREIDMTLGLGFDGDNLAIGVTYQLFDKFEKIRYAEDQGALYDESIIFKFNGYDNPWVFNKKSEVRRSYNNGMTFNIGADYLIGKSIKLSGSFKLGNLANDIKDNNNVPNPAGYWNKEYISATIHSNYIINNNLTAGLNYKFKSVETWSKHPDFNVILTESNSMNHAVELNTGYKASNRFKIGIGLFSEFNTMEYDDYYSSINWNTNGSIVGGKVLASYSVSEKFNLGCIFEHGIYSLDKSGLTLNEPTIYFTNTRLYDVYFYLTEYSYNTLGLELDLLTENIGGFNLICTYTGFNPENSQLYQDTDRNYFNIILEYRIDVY